MMLAGGLGWQLQGGLETLIQIEAEDKGLQKGCLHGKNKADLLPNEFCRIERSFTILLENLEMN